MPTALSSQRGTFYCGLPCPAPTPNFLTCLNRPFRLSCEVFRAMFAEQKAQAARSKSQGRSTSEYAPLVLPDVHPNGRSWDISAAFLVLTQASGLEPHFSPDSKHPSAPPYYSQCS